MKRTIPLILLVFLIIFGQAGAQVAPSLDSLTIELWPEYDRPAMLVLYTAVLSSSVSLPANLVFRIPVDSGGPHAVAVGPDRDSIADVVFTTQIVGDWIEISFLATTPVIRVEYYDPSLKFDGDKRTFKYDWPGDFPIDSVVINVQHPIGAASLQVSPTSGKVLPHEDGFTYNVIDLGALRSGEPFSLNLSYEKDTDSLSVESLDLEPSAPINPGAGAQFNLSELLPWLLGSLGVLLIAGGGFWYWRSGRETEPARRRHKTSREDSAGATPDGGIYCHQCGKRAEPGDRFCRSCGTHLRIE